MTGRIVNPPNIAIALKYDGKNAPKVVAKGVDERAEKIFNYALDNGIPLHEDPQIAQILTHVPVGEEIPGSLYVAIAQVIAFAYIISGKIPEQYNPTPLDE